jgi:hypothetical protein
MNPSRWLVAQHVAARASRHCDTREKAMTIKRAIENDVDTRILDDAELDLANGGSIVGVVIEILNAMITSPRDASSGLPTGKRSH